MSNVRLHVSQDLSRAELLAKAEELRVLADSIESNFDELKAKMARDARRNAFYSRDRKYLFRLPAWLWVPLVLSLVSLFMLALYAVSSR